MTPKRTQDFFPFSLETRDLSGIRADMHLGLDGKCPLRCAILTKTEMARRRHKFSSHTFHEDSFSGSQTLYANWWRDGLGSFNGPSAGT
jgi:hypothetical protein